MDYVPICFQNGELKSNDEILKTRKIKAKEIERQAGGNKKTGGKDGQGGKADSDSEARDRNRDRDRDREKEREIERMSKNRDRNRDNRQRE